MWTNGMSWPYQSAFQQATFQNWTFNGVVAGHKKSVSNFTYVEVEKAGHMVPHDQPAFALEMLKDLLDIE